MSAPYISVIIPVFNGERFLRQAIESVLGQGHPSLEVVVVDDGSTDASASIAESFGGVVCCVRQENAGPGAARNKGVDLSRGSLLAFLDADDLWLPDKLRLQLARFRTSSTLECVFGRVDHVYEPEVANERRVRVEAGAAGMVAGTMLIRREAFLKVGWFPEDTKVGEFIEWYGRAAEHGLRFEIIEQVVLHRRVHANNMTRRLAASRSDYLQILRSSLQRRRHAGP